MSQKKVQKDDKYAITDIKAILNHRGVNVNVEFQLRILHATRSSVKWVPRNKIKSQTFQSTLFKQYFRKTNQTETFKAFLFALDSNTNQAPEYVLNIACELISDTKLPPLKAEAEIHDNFTKKQIRNITYEQVRKACSETCVFPQKMLDEVCMMYSVDDNKNMKLQSDETLNFDDIKWNKNSKEKGNKKKLIPYKTGGISLKLYTADFCMKNGFKTSSFTSQVPNTTDNKSKNKTLGLDDFDLTIPVMSAREAVSHIHSKQDDNKNEEKEKGGNQNKKGDKKNEKASKPSLFEKAMSHYDEEFKPQNTNSNTENIQTNTIDSNSTLPQTANQNLQSSDSNQLLLNLIQVLVQSQTNNKNVQLQQLQQLQTDNKKDGINDPNEKDSKTDKKTEQKLDKKLKPGYMGRTIAIYDEWIKKSDVALVKRCKKLGLVQNGAQLDKEKRKLKFLAVKSLKIAREDAELSTRKWGKTNLPINETTKKQWTFDDAVKAKDIVQSIGTYTPPAWLIYSRSKPTESKADDQNISEQQTNAPNDD
eukprot:265387_1